MYHPGKRDILKDESSWDKAGLLRADDGCAMGADLIFQEIGYKFINYGQHY